MTYLVIYFQKQLLIIKFFIMKKLTKKSLDELARVMPVISENEQRACIGGYSPGESGINTTPYTLDEYNIMISSGTWQGGYVEGYGYISPDAIVAGDGRITSSFKGTSLGFIPAEGVGISGSFAYKGSYMIENGYMSVGCSIFSRFGNDISAGGEIVVYVNGQEVLCQSLSTNPSMIYESGSVPLGSTTFNLQQYSGNVEVKIRMGYIASFDSGNGATSCTTTIYSSYR